MSETREEIEAQIVAQIEKFNEIDRCLLLYTRLGVQGHLAAIEKAQSGHLFGWCV